MTGPVTVTQADREAAAAYLAKHGPCGLAQPSWIKSLLDGKRDDLPLLELLARHRLAAAAVTAYQLADVMLSARQKGAE